MALNVLLLALIPFADVPSKPGAFIVGLIALAVSIYLAAVCTLPHVRAAERSKYWRIAFASGRNLTATYAPGGAGWLGGLRRIRLLPVVVWIGLVTLGTAIALAMKEWLQVERPQRYAQILAVLLGGGAYVWAKRRSALRGKEVRRIDRRSPVLLLRSFGDDMLGVRGRGPAWAMRDLNRSGMTFERVASDQLSPFGPVITIGRPNEALAPLGAARDYVPDAIWQEEVQHRMLESAVVVMIVGTSEGLAWELRRLRDLGQLHKLMLLFPPSGDVVKRWQTLLAIDRASSNPVLPENVRPAETLALIYADDLTPIAILCQRDEWSYETAVRIAGILAITTGADGRRISPMATTCSGGKCTRVNHHWRLALRVPTGGRRAAPAVNAPIIVPIVSAIARPRDRHSCEEILRSNPGIQSVCRTRHDLMRLRLR